MAPTPREGTNADLLVIAQISVGLFVIATEHIASRFAGASRIAEWTGYVIACEARRRQTIA
jgi:hypothetical protein